MENVVFFFGNFAVGRVRNTRSGKHHHRIYMCNSEHMPVTICASLSRYFIEWNSVYLFKTVSADSGKVLVDILPFFKNNAGTASKILKAMFFLLINGI
jgi:hypothetical protein